MGTFVEEGGTAVDAASVAAIRQNADRASHSKSKGGGHAGFHGG